MEEELLNNPNFHRLMFKVNIFFVVTNAFFMLVLPESTINFVCAMIALFGAMSSYLVIQRLEDINEK